jgi:hypothetical protein
MSATREELVAAHLRYGAMAEALRTRAYAQIVAKALFLAGRTTYCTVDEIRRGCGQLVDAGIPDTDDARAALDFLGTQDMVQRNGSRYRLRRPTWDDLNDQINRRRTRIRGVYGRHFPRQIPFEDFREWFDDAAVDFFRRYGDKWVASVARQAGAIDTRGLELTQFLAPIIERHSLENHRQELVQGFRRWVQSENPADNEHVWSLGLAMFAARLVASGVAADPISTRELRDSTVLIDTNVLLVMTLEASRHAEAIAALGRALESIGCTLAYIAETKEEYQGVISRWRADTVRAVEKYGHRVVSKSEDDYIRTAVQRQCRLPSHYERFFAQISEPPSRVDGAVPVEFLDNEEVASWALDGANDAGRVHEIREFWSESRRRPKKKEVAQHDSALTEVGTQLRGGEAGGCWVLTLDRTMQELALRWCGPEGLPLWLSLDALLQILAVEHEGTDTQAVEFAPILSQLIGNEIEVQDDTYQVDDLRWLDEIESEVGTLPNDRVEEMARKIRKARMGGAQRSDSELRLEVGRIAQRARTEVEREAQRAAERVEKERARAEGYRNQLVEERAEKYVGRARRRASLRGFGWLLATAAAGAAAGWAFVTSYQGLPRADLIQLAITLGTPVLATAAGVWRHVLPRYKEETEKAHRRAEREVAQEQVQP